MKAANLLGTVTLVAALSAATVSSNGGAGGAKLTAAVGPSLTIYSGNLALVRSEVDRVVTPGVHTVRIDGLPTNIDPSSVIVLNAGVTLLGAHGFRTYQDPAGSGASLDLDLEVERRVERLQLAFLTTGLSWKADYAMVIARDDATARIDGYATIVNGSGTGYEDAEVQLLAGTIQGDRRGRFEADALRAAKAFEESAAVPGLQQAAFGDYHLYTVSTPISLRAGESRRIRLVGAESVRTEKEYRLTQSVAYHRSYPEPLVAPVAVSYRVERPEDSEFGGVPLPGGRVRILQRDEAGRIQLLGIANIANTLKGEDLRLQTGYAFDIVGRRTQTDYQRLQGNVYESAWRVELENETDSDVTVQVIERLSGDWRIVESSHRLEKLSAGAVRFSVQVPGGGEAVLTYRVRVRM
jgi:hypothetical protein